MSSRWVPGNRFTLLENGEGYFPRVFSAIEAAEREVLIETFIWFDDQVGQALRDALIAAARRGVEVHVLIDGWGSPDISPPFTQPMLDEGIKLRSFEPARRLFGARINMLGRMHHKLAVIDGRRAFVGGINYAEDHLVKLDAMSKQDYAVEVEGPLVGQIHAFCRANLQGLQPERQVWMRRWRAIRVLRPGALDPIPGGAVAAFVTRDNSN
ncbi:MAG TPA: phospholipase D-like domain-containing protein, partial [Hydrogenophaga sp.]|nr:phospholipase D-like domain-containing protein [Hydrogenophaga sp.]